MASTISRIGQHRRRPRWLAQGLDDLLARRPGQAATWLSWLRNAPQSPAERNILRLIGRLAYPARSNIQRGSGCQPAQRSEEHTSELQSLMRISYAVFCLKKKKNNQLTTEHTKANIKHARKSTRS